MAREEGDLDGHEDASTALPTVPRIHLDGNKTIAVVTPRTSTLANSFDPMYLVWTHPSVFPWGVGKRPEGMSLIAYFRILLERVPIEQFGHNVGLLFDMFDIWQRDQVSGYGSAVGMAS